MALLFIMAVQQQSSINTFLYYEVLINKIYQINVFEMSVLAAVGAF